MARKSAPKEPRKGKGSAPAPSPPALRQVTGPLRALLHELELRLGLFRQEAETDALGLFRAPVLLEANAPLPAPMRALFDHELAALERAGKATDACHRATLPPLTLYCLPYYYFDGFNAVIYVEDDGDFLAAWQEQEMHHEASPATILAAGPFESLRAVLHQALGKAG